MENRKGKSFFWLSYADLMTSLFFIMLVLFVIVVVRMQIRPEDGNGETGTGFEEEGEALLGANMKEEEQNRLNQIDSLFLPLIRSEEFIYLPESRKFVVKSFRGVEIFEPNQDRILPAYRQTTIEVGRVIEKLLKELEEENKQFTYQLVIEGNVANSYDYQFDRDESRGYKLSYARALAVYQLWKEHNIDLRPYTTEILICGSGFNGEDREETEENNKRFSIQIIPKVQSLEENAIKLLMNQPPTKVIP